jgi:hypothetical protein
MDREVEENGEDQGGIGEMCTTISAEKVWNTVLHVQHMLKIQ